MCEYACSCQISLLRGAHRSTKVQCAEMKPLHFFFFSSTDITFSVKELKEEKQILIRTICLNFWTATNPSSSSQP